MSRIPIDYVGGSHGNYLEVVCNQEFGIVPRENNFIETGASHCKSAQYQANKVFHAEHWFQQTPNLIGQFPFVISIRFAKDDLLLLSSVSYLRVANANLDNDALEKNTVTKLTKYDYHHVLKGISDAYPFLDLSKDDIPRHILREYFKFGFRDHTINGHWVKQQQMSYLPTQKVFYFDYSAFYNIDQFVDRLTHIASVLSFNFAPNEDFYQRHQTFLDLNPFVNHKQQCDQIVSAVTQQQNTAIPRLSLFQESYINGCLENIYHKEMPFHQEKYFISTQDIVYYLENLAPNL